MEFNHNTSNQPNPFLTTNSTCLLPPNCSKILASERKKMLRKNLLSPKTPKREKGETLSRVKERKQLSTDKYEVRCLHLHSHVVHYCLCFTFYMHHSFVMEMDPFFLGSLSFYHCQSPKVQNHHFTLTKMILVHYVAA